MTTPADELQRVFRTLSDPTRIRILRLVETEPLVVQELMEVLGMTQSRVSRHLGILRDAGLVEDRRDGTFVSYRFDPPKDATWQEAWQLVCRRLADDPTAQRDAAALAQVLEARSSGSRNFFDSIGAEWDSLRTVFNDGELRSRAISRLAEPGQTILDVGTGTGILALDLARLGMDVIGVDNSTSMLEAAQAKRDAQPPGRGSVTFERAEAHELPFPDGHVDAVLAHMVLHSLASPLDAITEMARVVRTEGRVIVADFVAHRHEWMRNELGVLWLGFDIDAVSGWFREAELDTPEIEVHEPEGRGRELPATFIASATKPGS